MNVVTLLSASVGQILGDAGMTVLIGMVVVFSVLLLLTVIFKLFGMTFEQFNKRKHAPKTEKSANPQPAPKATLAAASGAVPAVEDGISEEVVAAIMAAVSCMAQPGVSYRVRSIGRVKGERGAWAAAGVAEATRPF